MRNIAYRRVSSISQNTDRQLVNLSVTFDTEFADKCSGGNANRPQLKECLASLESGDVLWVHSIDRLARNVEDLRSIVFDLMDRGVTVKFVKEGLEFSGNSDEPMKAAISKVMMTMIGAFAEFEKAMINERTREGITLARERGVKFGGASEKHRETYQKNREAGLHKTNPVYQATREKQAPLVSRIRTMINDSNGQLTQNEMVQKLSAEGWKTVRGKEITQGGLSALIKKYGLSQ
jgi:DNA invertase Pin-like site-specific DNA recombinase